MPEATDWVVIDYKKQPAIQLCQRCGDQAPMPFNQPIGFSLDVMKAFLKQHRKCKARAGTTVCAHGTPTDERCYFCLGR